MQKTRKYKELKIFGASYWLDVDQLQKLRVEESFAQNNIETPNKTIEQGEIWLRLLDQYQEL
jgi:hypothetical protein